MLYALQLPQLKVLWKAWKRVSEKRGLMTLRELSGMLFGKLQGCCRIEATSIDLSNANECRDVVVGIVTLTRWFLKLLRVDGAEGSSGSHSPLSVAIWA